MQKQHQILNVCANSLKMVLSAVGVGIVAGLGGALYLGLVSVIFNIFFVGDVSFAFVREFLATQSRWGVAIILVPVVGGLIVTWLIKNYGGEQRGVSSPDLINFVDSSVAKKTYSIELVKAFASTISIGTGASVGQEIPIVQLGTTLSYLFSRPFSFSAKERMVLLAAGGAASLASAFNAPLTGIMFAVEILLFGFSALAAALIAIAAFVGGYIGQFFFGSKIAFRINLLHVDSWSIYAQNVLVFIPFGILIGLGAVLFNTGLNRTEYLFSKTIKNVYIRHMIGMIIVGVMLYALFHFTGHYYIDRVGHATIQQVLNAVITNATLLSIILICKLLSIWITLGSGASGGIFTPSLFLGAIIGALCSLLFQFLYPQASISHVYFIVCGMGGMLAGMTGGVLTAIVFIMEISKNYQIFVYLMITVTIATYIRLLFYPRGIYSFKLFQHGLMYESKWW